MSDPETRVKRERKLRNPVAKVMLENKGAFALRVIDPKKEQYKRVKLNPREVIVDLEDTEE